MHPRFISCFGIGAIVSVTGCVSQQNEAIIESLELNHQNLRTELSQLEKGVIQACLMQQETDLNRNLVQEQLAYELDELGNNLAGLRSELENSRVTVAETVVSSTSCPAIETSGLTDKVVLGRTEWIGLPEIGTYLRARIDTGADTSSMSATAMTAFQRDGQNWVRFKLGLSENDAFVEGSNDRWIEVPVTRRVRVLQASGEESRPVISLRMQLGPMEQNVEFTLTDRSHLIYPVLIGRRYLKDIALVDVAETYTFERPEFPGGLDSDVLLLDDIDETSEDEY